MLLSGQGNIWQDLLNWQRPLPENANAAPEAPSVHTNEAESLERHGIWIIVNVGIHELVGWYPFGVGTGVLPHVQVVLCLLTCLFISILLSRGVLVASIEECTATALKSQSDSISWTLSMLLLGRQVLFIH